MLTECNTDLFDFGSLEGRQVVGSFDGGAMTSDAGALLLGATEPIGRSGWLIVLPLVLRTGGVRNGSSTRFRPSLGNGFSGLRWVMKTSLTTTACGMIRFLRFWPASLRRAAKTVRRWLANRP